MPGAPSDAATNAASDDGAAVPMLVDGLCPQQCVPANGAAAAPALALEDEQGRN